jgi:hypothetical protein
VTRPPACRDGVAQGGGTASGKSKTDVRDDAFMIADTAGPCPAPCARQTAAARSPMLVERIFTAPARRTVTVPGTEAVEPWTTGYR